MYAELLMIHSWVRWLVLISLVAAVAFSFKGWLGKKIYSGFDEKWRIITVSIAHTQLILGACLYFISPIVDYFLNNFSEAIGERQVRFFGMEHAFMMTCAVVILTIGSSLAKRKTTDHEKFKTQAIWFGIGLLFILSSIPWEFSPLISRPSFRF